MVNNQLVAHGYNSGADDGGGSPRPYYNAIHDHWANNPSTTINAASADLPGYDIFSSGALAGESVTLTLLGASKWVSPPMSPTPGTVPTLTPLTAGETIFIRYSGTTIDTDALGSLLLHHSVSGAGVADLDLSYDIAARPADVLYILEQQLATGAPGVLSSATTYTILSPDGDNPAQRLHHASLFLENHLGTPIPEPTTIGVMLIAGLVLLRRTKPSRFSAQVRGEVVNQ